MKFRQLKKLSKVCVSTALALSLCLPIGMTAFAAQNENGAAVAEGETSVRAALTKVLEMGEGTTTPNAQFTFRFTQKTDADTVNDASGRPVPVVKDAVAIEDVTVDVNGKTGTDGQDGKKIVEVESADFLKQSATNANFTKAGIYVYSVTELADTYTIADAKKEKMTYSKAEYTVYVYVANKSDGSGVYVNGVGVVPVKNDAGEESTNTGVTGKVDPTPNPNPDPNGGGGVDEHNSKMKFTNRYLKTNGGNGDPKNPENRFLQVSKTVDGKLGDQSKYFDFNVTVKKPVIDTETTVYKGYVIKTSKNTVETDAANLPADLANLIKEDEYGKYIEFDLSEGGAKTLNVKLHHDQELAFTDASVGAHFQAVETAVEQYTPSLVVKANNVQISEGVTTTDSGERVVGESRENSARFTNTFEDVTPTGIIMNNLSFVMLIVVAVAAAAVMFVLKNTRRHMA